MKIIDLDALQKFLESLDINGAVPLLTAWKDNTVYKKNVCVLYKGSLYVCLQDHTSSVFFDTTKWKMVSGGGGGSSMLDTWKPNTLYNKDTLIIENSSLYICTQTHRSTTTFNPSYWRDLTGGSSATANYSQETKLNVKAPLDVTLNIVPSINYCFPPVTVLKVVDASTDVTENDFTFDSGDGKRFLVNNNPASDSKFLIFDGTVRPNHQVQYAFGSDISLGSGSYMSESEEIDLSEFSIIDKLSVINV